MRYIGSKASSVNAVVDLALNGIEIESAADAFGGLGIIGAALRRRNVSVTTCDVLAMPNAFQHTRLVCSATPRYLTVRRHLGLDSSDAVVSHLNIQRNSRSWFVREFADERMFFTRTNAARIAGVWDDLRRWSSNGWLSISERAHLTASFIDAVDACANTAGTYYAYLKNWDRKALRPFALSLIPIAHGLPAGQALLGDALSRLNGRKFDLLYLDPPYTDRDYARYYHLPESLARMERPDTNPESIAGLPASIGESTARFREALKLDYLQRLITQVEWKRLVVQYCDNAHIPLTQLRSTLGTQGKMQEFQLETPGYTTTSRPRRSRHHVFIVDKRPGATT